MKSGRERSKRYFSSFEEIERTYLPRQHEQRRQQSARVDAPPTGTGLAREMLQRLRRQLRQPTQ